MNITYEDGGMTDCYPSSPDIGSCIHCARYRGTVRPTGFRTSRKVVIDASTVAVSGVACPMFADRQPSQPSVDPDRLSWAISVAVQALAPKHTQPNQQEESHA